MCVCACPRVCLCCFVSVSSCVFCEYVFLHLFLCVRECVCVCFRVCVNV